MTMNAEEAWSDDGGYDDYYDERGKLEGLHRQSWPSVVSNRAQSFMAGLGETGTVGQRQMLFAMGFGARQEGTDSDAGPAFMSTEDMAFGFQSVHPDMVHDGIIGPETAAMIDAEFARGFAQDLDGNLTLDPLQVSQLDIPHPADLPLPPRGQPAPGPGPSPSPGPGPAPTGSAFSTKQLAIGAGVVVGGIALAYYALKKH